MDILVYNPEGKGPQRAKHVKINYNRSTGTQVSAQVGRAAAVYHISHVVHFTSQLSPPPSRYPLC